MRKTHALRHAALVCELEKRLSDQLEIIGCDAGLHCTTLLRRSGMTRQISDKGIVKELERQGIVARPLSSYYVDAKSHPKKRLEKKSKSQHTDRDGGAKPKQGLVFGFACATPAKIRRRMKDVATAIQLG